MQKWEFKLADSYQCLLTKLGRYWLNRCGVKNACTVNNYVEKLVEWVLV